MTYEYQVGEWYKTLGGFDAKVLDVDYKSARLGQRIVGKIKRDNGELLVTWGSDGTFVGEKQPNHYDLMPPVKREELWVNVEVVSDRYMLFYWHSKDQADNNITGDHFGMIRIVIEGDDFTVEKVTLKEARE